MKKVLLGFCVAAFFIACLAAPAEAIAPFGLRWRQKYLTGNKNEEFVKAARAANCKICHLATDKENKENNDYGKVVGKFLTKAEFEKLNTNIEASKKYILEGLEKAEAEKAADGTTYGERIKAGKLPVEQEASNEKK
ncbi:MAG TPA: hypothetical protein VMP01_12475 [Pirellulaceae bacterium]|nr:hypothetical protein [Pirellulaceae bacterium]